MAQIRDHRSVRYHVSAQDLHIHNFPNGDRRKDLRRFPGGGHRGALTYSSPSRPTITATPQRSPESWTADFARSGSLWSSGKRSVLAR